MENRFKIIGTLLRGEQCFKARKAGVPVQSAHQDPGLNFMYFLAHRKSHRCQTVPTDLAIAFFTHETCHISRGVILRFMMDLFMQVLCFNKFESDLCLEQALQTHAMMTMQNCPIQFLIKENNGTDTCSMRCKAIYALDNDVYDAPHCVEYNISFHINMNQSTQITHRLCDIKKCIIYYITIECWTRDFKSKNETDKFDVQIHKEENRSENKCLSTGIIATVIVSSIVVGCLVGIGILCVIYNFRNQHNYTRTLPTTLYQPTYQDGSDLAEGRVIINPLETEYADHFRMISKAIQVPSYKEDSSSSSRSRENIYHHLSVLEERENMDKDASVLISSDFLSYSCESEKKENELQSISPSLKSIIIHSGTPSLDSIIFHSDSPSIKSKDQ